MFTDLQATLELLLVNGYVSLAVITALVYDYSLTFSREIDYIWCRHWSWVSTMFILVRYVGLSWAIINALVGTTLVPGPRSFTILSTRYSEGIIIFLIQMWVYLIFLPAADLVMILRVYAMWSRSKTVLYFLLLIYASQIILGFVLTGIYFNPNTHLSVTVIEVIDISFCYYTFDVSPLIGWYNGFPRFPLGIALLVFAVTQTMRQLVEMYRVTKRWQTNRYMQVLVRDGFLYFLANMVFTIVSASSNFVTINSFPILFLSSFSSTAVCIMLPRFIIGVRELGDRETRGRMEGLDTGFGVLSQPITSQDTVSPFEFADFPLNGDQTVEGDEDGRESIPLRELGGGYAGPV